ncbi:hypothetical protein ACEWY4_022928 [Coilia grayii]|uniref:Uncharacterized protein n=1 Tax=Coilia grayii TaxID=363190 RepID=A0ABD1J453_9TELE
MVSAARVLAFIALLLFYEILFRLVFLCPCDPNYARHVCFCVLYIVLPACIFFNICILLDKLQACGGCTRTREHLPRSSVRCCAAFPRALSMGLLWLITALMNGDWYLCLMTQSNDTAVEQLACKENTDMTMKDQLDVRYYTNVSRFVGFGLILAVVLLWLGGSCQCMSYGQHLLEQQPEVEAEDILAQ